MKMEEIPFPTLSCDAKYPKYNPVHSLHFPDVASGSERALQKERKEARGEKKDNLFQQLVRFRGSGVTGHQLRSCLCISNGMPSSHYSLLLCSSL